MVTNDPLRLAAQVVLIYLHNAHCVIGLRPLVVLGGPTLGMFTLPPKGRINAAALITTAVCPFFCGFANLGRCHARQREQQLGLCDHLASALESRVETGTAPRALHHPHDDFGLADGALKRMLGPHLRLGEWLRWECAPKPHSRSHTTVALRSP